MPPRSSFGLSEYALRSADTQRPLVGYLNGATRVHQCCRSRVRASPANRWRPRELIAGRAPFRKKRSGRRDAGLTWRDVHAVRAVGEAVDHAVQADQEAGACWAPVAGAADVGRVVKDAEGAAPPSPACWRTVAPSYHHAGSRLPRRMPDQANDNERASCVRPQRRTGRRGRRGPVRRWRCSLRPVQAAGRTNSQEPSGRMTAAGYERDEGRR
jgi:hypothetical protein